MQQFGDMTLNAIISASRSSFELQEQTRKEMLLLRLQVATPEQSPRQVSPGGHTIKISRVCFLLCLILVTPSQDGWCSNIVF